MIDLSQIHLKTEYDWEKGITIAQNLIREGYRFMGWYDNEACIGEAITQLEPNLFQDIHLYAKWKK